MTGRMIPLRAALALAAIVACYDSDDYDLSPSDVDRRLQFAVVDSLNGTARSTVPADGFSRLTLTAAISPQADAGRRTLVFTTSAGKLLGATTSGSSVEAAINGQGTATVELESSTLAQDVRVRAEVKGTGLARELALRFVPVTVDSILRFTQVPAPLPADGATTATIIVTVAPTIPAASRSVTFTTQAGSFVQGGTVTPLADNTARVDLRAGSSLGGTRIVASVAGFATDTVIQFAPALPDTILLDGGLTVTAGQEVVVRGRLFRSVGTATPGTLVVFDASSGGNPVGLFRLVQPSNSSGLAEATFAAIGITPPSTVTLRATIPGTAKVGTTQIQVVP